MRKQTPESALLGLCLDYLAAQRILAFRMNTGAIKTENRFIKFGTPGMADILAFNQIDECMTCGPIVLPIWIECKAGRNGQSALQKSFQEQVEAVGHRYVVVRSLDDLQGSL